MLNVLERPDIALTLDPADEHQPGCEGPTHPQAKWGHQPSAPAAYLVVFSCGLAVLMCRGWCEARRQEPTGICHCICGEYHPTGELTFIKID